MKKNEKTEINEENTENKNKFKESILGTTVILGAICLVAALILALLNSLTAPVTAKRLSEEKLEAVAELFGDGTDFEEIDFDFAAPVTEAIAVKEKSSQKLLGYCVTVTPHGYGGNITILVAVHPDITVKNAKILSMSETSGIGTKIDSEDWFAEQFKGQKNNTSDGKVKAIAGATISSKAYLSGINAALAVCDEIQNQQTTELTETTDLTENETETENQTENQTASEEVSANE